MPSVARYIQQHLACPQGGFGGPAVPRHGVLVGLANGARKFSVGHDLRSPGELARRQTSVRYPANDPVEPIYRVGSSASIRATVLRASESAISGRCCFRTATHSATASPSA